METNTAATPKRSSTRPVAASPSLLLRARENPKLAARLILGTLLALNLIAAIALLEPFGGSPEGLEATRNRLEGELRQQQVQLASVRALAEKMQASGVEGTEFINAYFLEQRRASSEILQTLDTIEKRSGIRPRGKTFGVESIEGTTDFVMLTIAGNYEGTYGDLVEFASAIDRSERLLILDSLQVAPQQDGDTLQVQAQVYGFVRQNNAFPIQEDATGPIEEDATGAPGTQQQAANTGSGATTSGASTSGAAMQGNANDRIEQRGAQR